MKILHTEASQGYGGQEMRIVNEAKGMMDRGHDVQLVCPPDAQIADLARSRGIPVDVIAIGRKNLSGIRAMRDWIKQTRPDVINTHSSTDSWLVGLATRLMSRRPAIVRTRHISAPVSKSLSSRWLYTRSCDHVVTTGENLRQTLINVNGFPARQITSVRTGIDLGVYRPGDRQSARQALELDANAFIVGIVATLRSWKGHRYLVDAIASLPHDDLKLIIVGDGPQWDALHAQVEQAGLQSRVSFTGRQDNVAQWLQAMDIVCLPSYANEGVPQTLMQAQACGIPAVTTLNGSIDEAVIPDETALIVEPKNSASIAQAIQRLYDDTELRLRLGSAAGENASRQFSDTQMIDAMETIFTAAIALRGHDA